MAPAARRGRSPGEGIGSHLAALEAQALAHEPAGAADRLLAGVGQEGEGRLEDAESARGERASTSVAEGDDELLVVPGEVPDDVAP